MLSNNASNPGAVVIDGHGRADLGIVRALGEQGVPVYLFTDDRLSPVALSRFVTQVLPLPPGGSPQARVEALIAAGKRFRHRPVFFSSGDSSAVLFSRYREQLEPYYRHHLSAPPLIEDLYDKVRFAHVARELDLDVPFSVAPRDRQHLLAELARLHFPVIVKPAEKRLWEQHPRIHELTKGNLKGVRVDSAQELLSLYDALEPFQVAMVIQDYIEGRDEAIYELHAYIDREGEVIGCFSGQKLRTYPIHRGIGCFQVSVYEPEVVNVGLRNLLRLGYRGHAAVQLKRLPRSDRFQIFEINCRYSAWNYLHARAGVPLAYAAYRDSLGEKQPLLPCQREGMRWIDLRNDWRALGDYRRVGEWGFGGWLRSYPGRNSYAVFAWHDPAPLLAGPARTLTRAANFSLRRARRLFA